MENEVRHGAQASAERQALIAQAIREAERGGLEELDVVGIARRCGVNPAFARELFPEVGSLRSAVVDEVQRLLAEYLDREFSRIRQEGASDQTAYLRAACRGYFEFALDLPNHFAAYVHIDPLASAGLSDLSSAAPELAQRVERPVFDMMLELCGQAFVDPEDPHRSHNTMLKALGLAAGLHGVTHLATFGVLRQLSRTAKRQTFQAVMDTLFAGLDPRFGAQKLPSPRPHGPSASTNAEQPTAAANLPTNTAQQKRYALIRATIEQIVRNGPASVNVLEAAQRAGVGEKYAKDIAPDSDALCALVDHHLDTTNAAIIRRECEALGPDAQPLEYLKASGYGYFIFALSDPEGFRALIEVASGAFVPKDFHGEADEAQEAMGDGFKHLLDLTRLALTTGQAPRSGWLLYTQTMALWCTAHGMAHVCSNGPLRKQPTELLVNSLEPVLDAVLNGLVATALVEPHEPENPVE